MSEPEAVAVLFTDLVGSTARQSDVGDDQFDEIRRAHFAVLRGVVEANQGTEVKNLGDGLMVVFRSASSAIAAGVEMLVESDRQSKRSPTLAVGMKIGVSIGDAVVEDGDWFGTPVVEAARLCAACQSGQLLVTETVRLMAGSRTRERIEPVGPLDLKGLPEPVAAYEVTWNTADVDGGVPLPAFFVSVDGVPFAGRADERTTLATSWRAACDGSRRVVLIAGEPGIGKTRLISEVAAAVHGDGAVVLVGRSDDEIDVPYRPFAEALDQLARHATDDVIAAHVDEVGSVVARIAPALAKRAGVDVELMSADSDAERLRLFHGVADLLQRQAERAPVLLVLDDLHWADRSSLLLLRDLVRRLADARVLIVGTYRDTDLDRAHPLSGMLADFRREPGVERLALTGLSANDVLQYMSLVGGHELDTEAVDLGRQIATTTAGNPFFVSETLRHLAESGAIIHRDGRWVRGTLDANASEVPEGVREVIGRRLSVLDPDLERVLSIAAVAGAEFDSAVVGAVANLSEGVVVELLDEATARGLIVEQSDRFGWYRFAHALIRQTLIEELSTTRRLRLHRALGEEVERRAPGRVEEIAHHYLEAAATGIGDQAVDYAQRAARVALDGLAGEQASSWLRRALEAEEGLPPDPARRASLLIQLGEAAWLADEVLSVADAMLEAADLARAADRPDLLAMAAYWYLSPLATAIVGERVIPLLEEALAALASRPDDQFVKERMWVLGKLSGAHQFDHDPTERLALSEQALALGRQLEDPFDQWAALVWRMASLDGLGRYEEWEALIHECSAMTATLPATAKRAALDWELGLARTRGDTAAVTRLLASYRDLLEPLGLAWPGSLYGIPAGLAVDEGRFDAGLELTQSYREAATTGWDMSLMSVGAIELWPALWRADVAGFRAGLDGFPEAGRAFLAVYPLQATLAMLEHDDAGARRAFDEWRALLGFVPAAFTGHVFGFATYPTWRLGDGEVAAHLLEGLRPHAGRWLLTSVPSAGPADLHIGVNLLTLDDAPGAETALRAALALCGTAGARAWECIVQQHLAEALLAQGRRDETATHAAASRALAEELGMALVVEDLDRLGLA